QTDPTRCLTLGPGAGCEIEFWRREGSSLVAPRPNLCTDAVPVDEPTVPVAEPVLTAFAPRDPHAPTYPSRPAFAEPIYSDIGFRSEERRVGKECGSRWAADSLQEQT